jgi:repressor LexA
MKVLSPRQQQVFDFIVKYHSENGISPAITDIAEGLNLANTTIATYIDNLKKKGKIKNIYGVPRSFVVLKETVPTVGGTPILWK